MSLKTILRTVTALGLLAALGACSSSAEDSATGEGAVTGKDDKFGPSLFRDDFYTYLKADGVSDADAKKLVYLPTDAVMKPTARGASADERLASIDDAFKRIKPSQLYNLGAKTPMKATADLEKVLRDHPVHIVIVPGIFSEMIPRTPFEELFDQDTTAAREWKTKGAAVTDLRYSVKTFTSEPRPLSELVRVGSIDGADGAPLVTAAYLKAELGSLEDFGTEAENNEVYLRRLDAYFQALGGVPDNLYIMGYSRGTTVGLDLVVRAFREHKPWAPKIKGFLAHAGVIYGSQLADASFTGGPATDTLNLLREFVGESGQDGVLESCPGGANDEASADLQASNVAHWTSFIASYAALALDAPSHTDELSREGIDTALPDGARVAEFAAQVLGLRLPGAPDTGMGGILDLSSPSAGHCANVERFKMTARKIIAGAETLTTKARLDWWKKPENALPPGPRYFALTGTMGDATTADKPWAIATNPIAYDTGSIDFRSLRGNYYDMLAASGGDQLQDSQVAVQRGRFWPMLHDPSVPGATPFNPSQAPIHTYFMGTVGVHHWGLAFPRAFSSQDGLEANPFPRTTLLKAIATFVAQVDAAASADGTP
jgi:hypothetical protein